MNKILHSNEKKIIELYAVTTAIIYLAFWLGYYKLSPSAALAAGAASVIVFGIIYAALRKTVWAAIAFVFVVSASVGLSISSFFSATGMAPGKFLGVVLIIMLAYKALQAFLGGLIKSRKRYYAFFALSLVLELAACLAVGFSAYRNGPLLWQVFFALAICFFYSCSQITLRKNRHASFWRNAATAYLLGFVFILLLVVLLVVSIAGEDGGPLEILFEGAGEGAAQITAEGITEIAAESAGGRRGRKGLL